MTRFTDGMVAAGFVSRHDEPGHRGAAILELSAPGEDLVGRITVWRGQELTRIFCQLPQAERAILTHALRQLMEAGGEDCAVVSPRLRPRERTGPTRVLVRRYASRSGQIARSHAGALDT